MERIEYKIQSHSARAKYPSGSEKISNSFETEIP
jgi:hypothetical protein